MRAVNGSGSPRSAYVLNPFDEVQECERSQSRIGSGGMYRLGLRHIPSCLGFVAGRFSLVLPSLFDLVH